MDRAPGGVNNPRSEDQFKSLARMSQDGSLARHEGMLKWLIKNRLKSFQAHYDYDMSYALELTDHDPSAMLALAKVQKLTRYCKDVPKDVYWAAKVVATLSEDCGPCTQLVVKMALEQRVAADVLAAVIRGDDAALPEPVLVGVRFARASLAHDVAADDARDEIVKRWGGRALVSLAFALVTARIYPTLKYALGHGKTCTRVVVDGLPVAVQARAHAPA
jgi:hypothetical protein